MIEQLKVGSQCKRYGLSLWQCPQFLFLIMGTIIIATTIITYFIGERYINDPLTVALVIIILTSVLFVIAVIITQGFEKLAEANRMKSEFISIVSHQLRSPLTNLRWTLEFLNSETAEEKRFEYYKILQENSIRMGELIDNLLIVSRMEQGKFPLKKEEFSLEEFVKKVIKDSEQFAAASKVKIEFNVEQNLPKAFADQSQLKLLVDNLVSNAIRYTQESGKIEIELKRLKDNFYFKIKDGGIGIPEKDQKYIFQKFFRASNAQRFQTQGSGLGLYIAKCVVETSGGKIGFKSELEKGSTFWFTIPIK
jgi:signal transduction histidine kinase